MGETEETFKNIECKRILDVCYYVFPCLVWHIAFGSSAVSTETVTLPIFPVCVHAHHRLHSCGRRAKTTIRTASAFSKTESTNDVPLFARVSEVTVVPEWDRNKVINRTRSGAVGLAHQVRRLCVCCALLLVNTTEDRQIFHRQQLPSSLPLESLTSIVR